MKAFINQRGSIHPLLAFLLGMFVMFFAGAYVTPIVAKKFTGENNTTQITPQPHGLKLTPLPNFGKKPKVVQIMLSPTEELIGIEKLGNTYWIITRE